jgi:alkanesulfonate monooxygenase SsuD/methylene tetrahydromethanopterin reductase-like flavin-dependent oxidoreductase (luciferase family)
MGADLSRVASAEALRAAQGNQGIVGSEDRVRQLMAAEGIPFREAVAKPRALLVGTAETVADALEDWFTAGACDGFIVTPTVFPRMFEDVVRLLVPELQRRGLFRRDYAGRTLRENLRNP